MALKKLKSMKRKGSHTGENYEVVVSEPERKN